MADGDPPEPQGQGLDVTMPDAASNSTPHGGQDPDGHPDQGLHPNPDALGPDNQEGQQPVEPADMNAMVGAVFPDVIERLECQRLLQRIGFYIDAAQEIVCDHGYDTAKKLSRLKSDDVDILFKTLRSPGGEREDGTRDPGVNVPHLAQRALTSACFMLYHRERCDLCSMLNTITADNVFDLDLQRAREDEHNNDFYRKNRPKWDSDDPEKQTSASILRPFTEQTRPLVHICFANTSSPSSTTMLLMDTTTQTRQ